MLEVIRAIANEARLRKLTEQIEELNGKLAARGRPVDRSALAVIAAEKLSRGGPVSRPEAAAYLDVSTKHLQRMEGTNEKPGPLRRCPGLPGVVRYEARDILRLASAMGKEV
jgi:hypothetical protein